MSQMLAEMHQQPELFALRGGSFSEQALAALPARKPALIVFAARGSSDNACVYARYLFEIELGIPCTLAAPSVITRYGGKPQYENALFIGLSQSGLAPDVAAILQYARDVNCHSIAITNSSAGPVVDSANAQIYLDAGEEHAIAATKTFTLSMLALYQLCRALGGQLPPPDLSAAAQQMLDIDLADIPNNVSSAKIVFSLGRGYSFSVALEAALKLMECALLPCKPFSTADFAHGPMALADNDSLAVIFGQSDSDNETMQRLQSLGTDCIHPPPLQLDARLGPIVEAIFAQKLALAVALERGLDPDSPPNLSKVTRTR